MDPCWDNWYYAPGWAWDDPGCYGYSYYDPYISYYPGYDNSAGDTDAPGNSAPADSSPAYDQDSAPVDNPQPPDDSSGGVKENPTSSGQVVSIFLKNGAEFDANSYWIENGQLHYTLTEGGEIGINLDQVDLQRTIEQNARRGIYFNSSDSQNAPNQRAATD